MPAEVRIDQAAVRRAVTAIATTAATRAGGRIRDRAKAEITAAGRVDTGQMRNGIVARTPRTQGSTVSVDVVSTAQHSLFQHDGTAGNGSGWIYPRRAKVLRFRPRGGSFVFAPRVRGVKGVPFMRRALDKTTPRDFT